MADPKYKIRTYNAISQVGLKRFSDHNEVSENIDKPDAILLRSFDLNREPVAESVLAIGRAGAGVNNIPVEKMSKKGIVVFNAPGANANAVKELVIAGMLLSARNLPDALAYCKNLPTNDIKTAVEQGKKKFAGKELSGKTLGVIGLGAIGYRVANLGVDLGMSVLGYDPAMTVQNAWQLSPAAQKVDNLDLLLAKSGFITIHVPLMESTRGLISAERLRILKPAAILLNFSRDELVDEKAVITNLNENKLSRYVTDFPNEITYAHDQVIALPHLGASTVEAEDSSAVMVAGQLQDFLNNGNIKFSVNFPNAELPRKGAARLTFAHKNEPGVVAQITNILGKAKINIAELLNNSRGNFAYTIVDIEVPELPEEITNMLSAIPELLKLRLLL